MSLSLEIDFVITSISYTPICALRYAFTTLQSVAGLAWEKFGKFAGVALCHFSKGHKLEFISYCLSSNLGIATMNSPAV